MKDQVFTIEQMKTLMEVGVDIEMAKSMSYYATYESEPKWFNVLRERDNIFDNNCPHIPTFTTHDAILYLNNIIEQGKLSIFYNEDCEWVVGVMKIFKDYETGAVKNTFDTLHKDPDLNCALYQSILKLSKV